MEVHGHVHILEIPLTGCIPELPIHAKILIVDYICQGASVLSTSAETNSCVCKFLWLWSDLPDRCWKLP